MSILEYFVPEVLVSIQLPYISNRQNKDCDYLRDKSFGKDDLQLVNLNSIEEYDAQEDINWNINIRQEISQLIKKRETDSLENLNNDLSNKQSRTGLMIEDASGAVSSSGPSKASKKSDAQKAAAKVTTANANNSLTDAFANNSAKRRNRFDDIIQKLERKYTTMHSSNPVHISYDYDDDSDSIQSDNDNNADNEKKENTEGDGKELVITSKPTPKSRSQKRKRNSELDFYDLDDDFVDDSEYAEAIETIVAMKAKTKQDGFFVSSGDIEVLENDTSDDSDSSDSDSSSQDGDSVGEQRDFELSQTQDSERKRRLKPSWTPNEEIKEALETFKAAISSVGPIPKKSNIPISVNQHMRVLDLIVRKNYKHIQETLKPVKIVDDYEFMISRTSGYLEAIVEALGNQIPNNRVKKLIMHLEYQEQSSILKKILDDQINCLKTAIENSVSVIVPTPAKEPDPASSDVPSSSSKVVSVSENAHDFVPNNSQLHPNETSKVSDDISQPTPDASSKYTENNPAVATDIAQDNTVSIVESNIDNTVPKTPVVNKKSESIPNTIYKYRCTWTAPMRELLANIDQLAEKWIIIENKFRDTLIAEEMMEMDDDDCEDLELRDVMDDIFKDILSAYPPDCAKADAAALKSYIATERRRKKKETAGDKDASGDKDAPSKPEKEKKIPLSIAEEVSLSRVLISRLEEITKARIKRRRISLDRVEALSKFSSPSTTKPISSSSSNVANKLATINSNKSENISTKKELPNWVPNEIVRQALEEFRSEVNRLGIVLKNKSSLIPHTLDEALLAAHSKIVENYHKSEVASSSSSDSATLATSIEKKDSKKPPKDDFLKKTTGYYESLVEILGGAIPIGRVKYFLRQLELKESAKTSRCELDKYLEEFKALIPKFLREVTKVEEPQESNPKESSTSLSLDVEDQIDQSTHSNAMEISDEAKVSEQISSNLEIINNNNAIMTASGGVVASTNSQSEELVDENGYRYHWTVESRQLLLKIDRAAIQWIHEENAYRKCLSSYDLSVLDVDNKELDYKEKVIEVYNIICSYFPRNCINSDISAIRKQMSIERSRLRNVNNIAALNTKTNSSQPHQIAPKSTDASSDRVTNALLLLESKNRPVIRIQKEKPVWKPNEQIQYLLDEFKVLVESLQVKPIKNGNIPDCLEEPLYHLHNQIKEKYRKESDRKSSSSGSRMIFEDPSILTKTVGYFETIADMLGSNIVPGKVKNVIKKVEYRLEAKAIHDERILLLDKFKQFMLSNIIEGSCTNDKSKGKGSQPNKNDPSDSHNRDSSYWVPDPIVDEESLNAADSSTNVIIDADSHITEGVKDGENVINESTRDSIHADVETEKTTLDEKVQIPVPSTKIYDRRCNWTSELRSILFDIEVITAKWIRCENQYRTSLTAHDKRLLAAEHIATLKEKDVMQSTLEEIASYFPGNCMSADISALKHFLSLEKRRIRKGRNKDEKIDNQAKPSTSSASVKVSDSSAAKPFKIFPALTLTPKPSLSGISYSLNKASNQGIKSTSDTQSKKPSEALAKAFDTMNATKSVLKLLKSPFQGAAVSSTNTVIHPDGKKSTSLPPRPSNTQTTAASISKSASSSSSTHPGSRKDTYVTISNASRSLTGPNQIQEIGSGKRSFDMMSSGNISTSSKTLASQNQGVANKLPLSKVVPSPFSVNLSKQASNAQSRDPSSNKLSSHPSTIAALTSQESDSQRREADGNDQENYLDVGEMPPPLDIDTSPDSDDDIAESIDRTNGYRHIPSNRSAITTLNPTIIDLSSNEAQELIDLTQNASNSSDYASSSMELLPSKRVRTLSTRMIEAIEMNLDTSFRKYSKNSRLS